MTTFDAATEAHIQRLVDALPPLTDEQAALIVRTFARNALTWDSTREIVIVWGSCGEGGGHWRELGG